MSYLSLRSRSEFDRVFQSGTRHRSGGVIVVHAAGSFEIPRVGLVVTRKVGGAVQRNRVKRRLRAALRVVPLEQGRDYVVIASSSVVEARFENLVSWLRDAVRSEEKRR